MGRKRYCETLNKGKKQTKVRYETEIDAMIAAARYARERGEGGSASDYYRCPLCGGFHLTGLPQNR